MKKENILNFLVDYAYNINDERCEVKQDLENCLMDLSSKDKGLLYKRLHETDGILEAVDNLITYIKYYPNDDDFKKISDKAENYAYEVMSKLRAKNINEDVKQAIINAYIKGFKE